MRSSVTFSREPEQSFYGETYRRRPRTVRGALPRHLRGPMLKQTVMLAVPLMLTTVAHSEEPPRETRSAAPADVRSAEGDTATVKLPPDVQTVTKEGETNLGSSGGEGTPWQLIKEAARRGGPYAGAGPNAGRAD